MKKFLTLILLINLSLLPTQSATTFEGGVSAEGTGNASRIVDRNTGLGVEGATITLPKQRYTTQTDSNGFFELNTQINGPSIMSIQKEEECCIVFEFFSI